MYPSESLPKSKYRPSPLTGYLPCSRCLARNKKSFIGSGVRYDLLLHQSKDEAINRSKEEDMAELAVITKRLDFHLEQVQDFTPTPMTVATEAWYTGFHPYTLEPIFSAKTQREKLAQRQFFFWYKPEERRNIINELRRIGRSDLIDKLYGKR